MIGSVRTGNIASVRGAIQADWLGLPVRERSLGMVVGDGSLIALRYPDGYRALASAIRAGLKTGGVLALRVYVRPHVKEDGLNAGKFLPDPFGAGHFSTPLPQRRQALLGFGSGPLVSPGQIDDAIDVSGHRLSTMEVESALVAHHKVAEAAVAARLDDLRGQAIAAFVTLKLGHAPAPELKEELCAWVAKEIGSLAKPDDVRFTEALPKTRSGKDHAAAA
jgi:hypothetical protein